MKSMIEAWRREAGRCFPFYQVQIAPFLYKSKDNGPALIREAQEWVTRHTEETVLVVISDCVEDISTIHPINKRPVGKRLVDLALAKKYKVLNGIHENLKQCKIEDNKLVLTFSSVQNGIICRDKEIKGMEIAGPDGVFVRAKVVINSKNKLLVFSPKVEIPKSNGDVRQLGIPTVVDRTLQQAIAQVLQSILEEEFQENSYGFRPGKSCEQAVLKLLEYLNDEYEWIVDIDLEKFFDNVPRDKLMSYVGRVIHDPDTESLIRKYLKSGVMENGLYHPTEHGTPQGALCTVMHKAMS